MFDVVSTVLYLLSTVLDHFSYYSRNSACQYHMVSWFVESSCVFTRLHILFDKNTGVL